jgi:hypothetical protein
MFEEIKQMSGIDEKRKKGKLVVGLKNDQINLAITSSSVNSGGEKIVIHLPSLA